MQVYSKMWDFMNARKHVFVKTYDEGIKRVRDKKGEYKEPSWMDISRISILLIVYV